MFHVKQNSIKVVTVPRETLKQMSKIQYEYFGNIK